MPASPCSVPPPLPPTASGPKVPEHAPDTALHVPSGLQVAEGAPAKPALQVATHCWPTKVALHAPPMGQEPWLGAAGSALLGQAVVHQRVTWVIAKVARQAWYAGVGSNCWRYLANDSGRWRLCTSTRLPIMCWQPALRAASSTANWPSPTIHVPAKTA